jgi:hypothetical protein
VTPLTRPWGELFSTKITRTVAVNFVGKLPSMKIFYFEICRFDPVQEVRRFGADRAVYKVKVQLAQEVPTSSNHHLHEA